MGTQDKIKLDGVAENANNYVHPTAPEVNIFPLEERAGRYCVGRQTGRRYGETRA